MPHVVVRDEIFNGGGLTQLSWCFGALTSVRHSFRNASATADLTSLAISQWLRLSAWRKEGSGSGSLPHSTWILAARLRNRAAPFVAASLSLSYIYAIAFYLLLFALCLWACEICPAPCTRLLFSSRFLLVLILDVLVAMLLEKTERLQ
jgi:hypothetical protein